jgi:small subunit ribosomal protein S11e
LSPVAACVLVASLLLHSLTVPLPHWYICDVAVMQTEKAYQKQDAIFIGKSRAVKAKKGSMRYYKSIGLGFKTPKEAVEGSYVDKKCPFTGNVSIRGRILKGMIISHKMKRTIVVRRDYLQFVSKYRR